MLRLFICHPVIAYRAIVLGIRLGIAENNRNSWN